eukprot:TRINITY_DN4254_c0_g2_i2.p1 TRINITY_DN4254_c0_g2~~TRINITY_DN4254_c0_g2_i2.p1  ORF type:complete len:772 (+),score=114.94 TRINITY_DN4254_c0_g2_i2:19-2334(+)
MIKQCLTFLVLTVCVIGCYSEFNAPTLKWSNNTFQTGWYASPIIHNISNRFQVYFAARSVIASDGEDGHTIWEVPIGNRVFCPMALADINNDGIEEIIAVYSNITNDVPHVMVLHHNGTFMSPFPVQLPSSNEPRGMMVADLDMSGDKKLEIIITAQHSGMVINSDGTVELGWPIDEAVPPEQTYWGFSGFYGMAVAHLDNNVEYQTLFNTDGYINALRKNATPIPANALYYYAGPGHLYANWGHIRMYATYWVEKRGWGCQGNIEEDTRCIFTGGGITVDDMDGDGVHEVIATPDCTTNCGSLEYPSLWVLNTDRSRFVTQSYNWTDIPRYNDTTSYDWGIVQLSPNMPVTADIDGDGIKEVIFASPSGHVYAVWLDQSVRYNWPFNLYDHKGNATLLMPTEPVIVDIDNDGYAEVIFASFTSEDSSTENAYIFILDYQGNLIHKVPFGASSLASPTVGNLDSDPELELAILGYKGQNYAFDLPNSTNARIIWHTSRGNYQRNAFIPIPSTPPPTNPPTFPQTDPPTNPPTNTPTDPPTNTPTNPPTSPPTDSPTSAPVNSLACSEGETRNSFVCKNGEFVLVGDVTVPSEGLTLSGGIFKVEGNVTSSGKLEINNSNVTIVGTLSINNAPLVINNPSGLFLNINGTLNLSLNSTLVITPTDEAPIKVDGCAQLNGKIQAKLSASSINRDVSLIELLCTTSETLPLVDVSVEGSSCTQIVKPSLRNNVLYISFQSLSYGCTSDGTTIINNSLISVFLTTLCILVSLFIVY